MSANPLPDTEFMYADRPSKSIYRITFNRPEKLNAFNFEMYEELTSHLDVAEDDDDVKAIILRGEGTSFGSGQDLSRVGFVYGFDQTGEGRRPSMRRRLAVDRRWAGHYSRYADCSKVTISQVQGHCLGTHFVLAITSDFIIATEDANIGHPGMRLVGPGLEFNLMAWMWNVGKRLSTEMLFTGRTLSGTEAAELGVVNKAVPSEDLESEVLQLAEKISLMPADGVVMAKEAMRMMSDLMGIRAGFTYGAMSHTMNTNARFEPDEFNYFRERREKGAKNAFHQRDERYAAIEKTESDAS